MNMQKQHALIVALSFFFSLATPAFASKDRDFNDQPASKDPVVQTTSGSKEYKGENIKNDKITDNQADFKKETPKKDPVVRHDNAKAPQPSHGEGIKSESKIAPVTESVKKDPVVRHDDAKVPQPSRGEDIKSDSRIETVN